MSLQGEASEVSEGSIAERYAAALAAVGAAPDVETAAVQLVRGAATLLGAAQGSVAIYRKGNDAGLYVRVRGAVLDVERHCDPAPGTFIAAMEAGAPPLLLNDYQALDPATYPLYEPMRRRGMRGALAVPLEVAGLRIGSLHLDHSMPGGFGSEALALACGLASLAGAAIDRVRLEAEHVRAAAQLRAQQERLAQMTHRLRLFLDVANAVGSSLKVDAPLDVALRRLVKALPGTDTAAIFVFDPTTGLLAPRAFVGLGPEFGAIRLRPGEGISGTSFRNGRTVRTETTADADALNKSVSSGNRAHLVAATQLRVVSRSISVPLRTQEGDAAGSLTVSSGRAEFTAEDEHMLEGLAAQVAVALDNARLYEQTRTQAEALAAALHDLKAAQAGVVQQERLRALGQMAAGVAHDLNNTLVPVVGYSELLLAGSDAPDALSPVQREWLRLVHEGARDAAQVVARLKEFYRARSDEDVHTVVDPADLVRQVLALTRPKWRDEAGAAGRSISAEEDLPAAPLPPVLGSAGELREVFTNLVFNAVDALPEGGVITLRARFASAGGAGHVVFEVADTGMGMDEETRRRCLEPFFSTKGNGGTGLGLAMVYGSVVRHRGIMEVESAPRQGTTVRLRFPIASPEARMAMEAPAEATAVSPLRILLVDDDSTVRTVVAAMLERDGHFVAQAPSGEAGITMLEAGNAAPAGPQATGSTSGDVSFDLIITDRAMPGGMSGEQLAEAAKALRGDVPVMMLTGFGELMMAAGERPAGVDLVLGKPVTLAVLRRGVSSVMQQAQARAPVG